MQPRQEESQRQPQQSRVRQVPQMQRALPEVGFRQVVEMAAVNVVADVVVDTAIKHPLGTLVTAGAAAIVTGGVLAYRQHQHNQLEIARVQLHRDQMDHEQARWRREDTQAQLQRDHERERWRREDALEQRREEQRHQEARMAPQVAIYAQVDPDLAENLVEAQQMREAMINSISDERNRQTQEARNNLINQGYYPREREIVPRTAVQARVEHQRHIARSLAPAPVEAPQQRREGQFFQPASNGDRQRRPVLEGGPSMRPQQPSQPVRIQAPSFNQRTNHRIGSIFDIGRQEIPRGYRPFSGHADQVGSAPTPAPR